MRRKASCHRKLEEMGNMEVGPPEVTSHLQPEISAHILTRWSSDRGTQRGVAGHVYEICSAGEDFQRASHVIKVFTPELY